MVAKSPTISYPEGIPQSCKFAKARNLGSTKSLWPKKESRKSLKFIESHIPQPQMPCRNTQFRHVARFRHPKSVNNSNSIAPRPTPNPTRRPRQGRSTTTHECGTATASTSRAAPKIQPAPNPKTETSQETGTQRPRARRVPGRRTTE
jgi:hypothetical protein